MKTVLALRALGLGDALTALPALRGLRRAYPDSRLVWAGPGAVGAWFRRLDVVDDVVVVNGLSAPAWTGEPPDVAVNLHGSGPQSHALLQRLHPGRLVAFACAEAGHSDGPSWPAELHEVSRWGRLVTWAGGRCSSEDLRLPAPPRGDHVVIHPGAASGSRRWPPERWANVARQLAKQGQAVLVTGTPAESAACARVAAAHPLITDACGLHDLAGLAHLVGSARLLLCGDTGVAHVGTAFGTPSVLLFGPVSPALWGPLLDRDRHVVLWHQEPGDGPGDPHADRLDERLARVQPEEVVLAAEGLLSGTSPASPTSRTSSSSSISWPGSSQPASSSSDRNHSTVRASP